MKKENTHIFLQFIAHTVLNSYAMLFFSNRKTLAVLILLVTFFNPYTGAAGFAATFIAAATAWFIGFSREQVKSGLYTYSGLLMGLGMGTFYEFSQGFWILLFIASVLSVLLSAALIARLGKSNLPALSLAFILTLWVVILSSREFAAIGLTQRNIYWLNEMYATGGNDLIRLVQWMENLPLPAAVAGFFRSLSAIIFQSNIAAGIVLTIGLFFFSRIALSLMIAGYAIAILFIQLMDGYAGSINYYNLGTNFMLVSLALGGFYIIPSLRSYLWSLITVPVSYILVIALWKITYTWGLPVFSLPFCITVILFIFVLQLRQATGKMVLTPIQYYSPEENLYRYLNSRDRLYHRFYLPLQLPFNGAWTVSQGYEGKHTHKGDWSNALDFVIKDKEGKTWQGNGTAPEDFYCFNKPVLCPADAVVEEVISYVEDNPVGGNNTRQNWGNTIVLKHAEGLYTKLSHLKKGSSKVTKGEFVKKGMQLAACGNSGRSPEPHLHFQVQSTPYIGSRTIAYPFSGYLLHKEDEQKIPASFAIPPEDALVSNIQVSQPLLQAFDFKPGLRIRATAEEGRTEDWEVMVSAYNETYFYCAETASYAYFINDGSLFYFTNFYGNRNGLLYLLYITAYKILMSPETGIPVYDHYPQGLFGNWFTRWIQDLAAPFYLFTRWTYSSQLKVHDGLSGGEITLDCFGIRRTGKKETNLLKGAVTIKGGAISGFTLNFNHQKTTVTCVLY
ncbi:MAG: urea transporter [Chitinophagales bacterium]|nr:urea transporter [Chitinophagales bacterium]